MQMNASGQILWVGPIIKLSCPAWSFICATLFTNLQDCLTCSEVRGEGGKKTSTGVRQTWI